jgi:hypothetical protein
MQLAMRTFDVNTSRVLAVQIILFQRRPAQCVYSYSISAPRAAGKAKVKR